MVKGYLRKTYLEKRQGLSEEEYHQRNQNLYNSFFTFVDLSFVKTLHTFLPITEKKEPDTWLIIERILREFPHIRISIPRVNSETGRLDNFYFEKLTQWQKNKWGVPEPQQGISTDADKIDLVIVPLLAFDVQGHRVGYGKGFYDRFLHTCPQAIKIGLSFFPPVENIDHDAYDIKLNSCVIPGQYFRFN